MSIEKDILKRVKASVGAEASAAPNAPAAGLQPAVTTEVPVQVIPQAPVAPAPDAAIAEARAEAAKLKAERDEIQKQRDAELVELTRLKAEQSQRSQLDWDKLAELDGDEREKVLVRHMKAMVDQKVQDALQQLNPLKEQVARADRLAREQEIERAYPGTSDKYRDAMHAFMDANPSVTAVQALKAVADPADLMAQPSRTSTPAQSVHVEVGRPTRSVGMPATATAQQNASPQEKMRASIEARQSGNWATANKLQQEAVLDRLSAAGVIRQG